MTGADIEACLQIEEATYPQPWTRGVFADELSAPGRVYVVAADGTGRIVGYGGVMLVIPEAHITSLTVAPSSRGRSWGTRLMLHLAQAARAAGANSLTLEVRVSNKNAQSLYAKFGMAPVGLRKHYYRDEDALIMWVHDIDEAAFGERLEAIGSGLDQEVNS